MVGRRGLPLALSVLGLMSAPGGWVRRRYFSFVFLFDVGEESGIGEVPFATGAPEFSLRFFLGFYGLLVIASTFLFTH